MIGSQSIQTLIETLKKKIEESRAFWFRLAEKIHIVECKAIMINAPADEQEIVSQMRATWFSSVPIERVNIDNHQPQPTCYNVNDLSLRFALYSMIALFWIDFHLSILLENIWSSCWRVRRVSRDHVQQTISNHWWGKAKYGVCFKAIFNATYSGSGHCWELVEVRTP